MVQTSSTINLSRNERADRCVPSRAELERVGARRQRTSLIKRARHRFSS
jgi:hypothetical protein